MNNRIESVIIRNLVYNEEFARKVLPFLSKDYFKEPHEQLVFEQIHSFITTYNRIPTFEALVIDINKMKGINEHLVKYAKETLVDIKQNEDVKSDQEWLLAATENFCKDKAVENAVIESIHIIDGKSKQPRSAIPQLLSDSLGVGFDTNVGHDFLGDAVARYDFYHKHEKRVPFAIEELNKITGGGVCSKTLNILMAGTNGFKTGAMCSFAADNLVMGQNVLYITLEMSEEKIAERIDANLMNVPLDELKEIPRELFFKKINRLQETVKGKLIIKEYPTASASVINFRALLNELYLKKNFKPDIIYIDYLNICASSRFRNASENSYGYVKAISEEVRGLAVEFDVPIISATQTNRSGYNNSDVDLTETSDSFGIPMTADLFLSLYASVEMQQMNQILFTQLKNRYRDKNVYRKFIIGADRARMKLYHVEQSAQNEIVDEFRVSVPFEKPALNITKRDFGKLKV